jgi:hypothetical protein
LITDVKVLEWVLAVRFKGAHYAFATEERLPRLTIDLFAKSNGVIIKVGVLLIRTVLRLLLVIRNGLSIMSGFLSSQMRL